MAEHTRFANIECRLHARRLLKRKTAIALDVRKQDAKAESADADIEMTTRKAFPAILRLRDRSYRKPIE